jgi:sulfoxide reductase catalytic subunit YedY
MLIRRQRAWEPPERTATPEAVFLDRRRFLAASGLALGAIALPRWARAESDPSAGLYPAKRNEAYGLDRAITPESFSGEFNNFYEFGSHKRIAREAQKLPLRPWTIELAGLLEQPRIVDIDALLKAMPLEERLYRHRCVEAWSMAVPWTGFPLKALLDYARPLGSAKYVVMQTFLMPEVASGQKQFWYPWPYTEGLAIDEAANELAFMATGVYGKPLPKQFGAPLRLAAPWKYGFKSVKSIVRIEFAAQRPTSFWEEIAPAEYGFWANVNPEVPHPRWSQAEEEVLGEGRKVATQLYNGYGEQVAHLYKERQTERLFA